MVNSNFGATVKKLDKNSAPKAEGDDTNTGLLVKAGNIPANNAY
jgi:hypothetical protein